MLTPVDVKQKRFKGGIGYDKNDVNAFFDEVVASYQEQYKTNAELKEKIITLTDENQHYKIMEEDLQKRLMLAEKNTEVSRSNAEREAKTIEMEAKSRASEIVSQAYVELDEIQNKIKELETKYAEYKSGFAELVMSQFKYLELHDIDPEAMIDPNYASGKKSSSGGHSFGDDSGGLGAPSSIGSSREDKRSNASNVYGTTLGGEGIDPFGSSPLTDVTSLDDLFNAPIKPTSMKNSDKIKPTKNLTTD
ncbi:MAG: DivIVA domain-containing protein [Eubacterium sp.]|nr:DivIVA domain-containing protein [Eubacterium sp.]